MKTSEGMNYNSKIFFQNETIPKVILIGGYHESDPVRSVLSKNISYSLLRDSDMYNILLSKKTLIVTEDVDLIKSGAEMSKFLEGDLRIECIARVFGYNATLDFLQNSQASICFADYRRLPGSSYSQFSQMCKYIVDKRLFYVRNRIEFSRSLQRWPIENEEDFVISMIKKGIISVNRKQIKKVFEPLLKNGIDSFNEFQRNAMLTECDKAIVKAIDCNFNKFEHIVVPVGMAHAENLFKNYFFELNLKSCKYVRFLEDTVSQKRNKSLYRKKSPKCFERFFCISYLKEIHPKITDFILNS